MSNTLTSQMPLLILLVDDFDALRKWVALHLKKKGYLVMEARNGQEAIDMAQLLVPDLIVMDLEMPVLNGFSATKHLREMDSMRDVPVIAFSSFDADSYRKESLAAGCTHFTTKSADISKLEEIIDTLLS